MKGLFLATVFAALCWSAPPSQIRADANVVLINATVLDRQDRLVRGLTRDQFLVFDDKAEQKIAYFSEDEAPVSLAVLFDVSGSMQEKIAGMRAALKSILQSATAEDEFSLVTFADEPQLAIGWTQNPDSIQNALLDVAAHGQTSLLDAAALGLRTLRTAKNPRRAMVIFSDGGDNHSRATEHDIARSLVESGVQIYAVDLAEPLVLRARSPEEIAGPDLLERICDQAGGRYFEVDGKRALSAAAEQLSRELRSEYLIGYVLSNDARDGRFHHVRLELKQQAGMPKVTVFWRRGYRAPGD